MIPVRPRSGARRLGRRDLLRVSPAALAAGLWPPPAAAGQRIPVEAPSDILECAATLAGLEFTAGQRDLMRSDVARNRRRYAALREVDIAPDTAPAFAFRSSPAGSLPPGRATGQHFWPAIPISCRRTRFRRTGSLALPELCPAVECVFPMPFAPNNVRNIHVSGL